MGENKGKITIKINGEEKPFNDFDYEWKNVEKEIAASEEIKDDEIDWYIPTVNKKGGKKKNVYAFPKKNGWNHRSKRNVSRSFPLSAILMSIFAIATGCLIAFFMWNILVNNDISNKNEPSVPASASPTNNGNEIVTLKRLPTYIVQAGVFTKEESAKAHKNSLEEKKLPAGILKTSEDFRVFIGLAPNQEMAKKVQEKYKKIEEETYAREIIFPEREIKGISKTEKEFLESALSYYETLLVINNDLQLLGKSSKSEELKETLKKLKELEGINNKTDESIHKHLVQSGESFQKFIVENSQEDLLNGQKSLIRFVEEYSSL